MIAQQIKNVAFATFKLRDRVLLPLVAAVIFKIELVGACL
jgi:hypothetical protein